MSERESLSTEYVCLHKWQALSRGRPTTTMTATGHSGSKVARIAEIRMLYNSLCVIWTWFSRRLIFAIHNSPIYKFKKRTNRIDSFGEVVFRYIKYTVNIYIAHKSIYYRMWSTMTDARIVGFANDINLMVYSESMEQVELTATNSISVAECMRSIGGSGKQSQVGAKGAYLGRWLNHTVLTIL